MTATLLSHEREHLGFVQRIELDEAGQRVGAHSERLTNSTSRVSASVAAIGSPLGVEWGSGAGERVQSGGWGRGSSLQNSSYRTLTGVL